MSRRLVVLLLLVSGAAAFLFLWDLPQERRAEEEQRAALRLAQIDPAKVDRLRVTQPEGSLLIAREGEGWWLQSPVHELANSLPVENVIESFARAESYRLVMADADTTALDAFALGGLRAGDLKLELLGDDGSYAGYWLGRANPSASMSYLRLVGSDDVHLVELSLRNKAAVSYQSYRIYDLFAVEADEITELTVRSTVAEFSTRRDDDDLWFTREDQPQQLRRPHMERIVHDLADSRIRVYLKDFVLEEEWAAFRLDEPLLDIQFSTGDGRSGRIRVGSEESPQNHYARRDDATTILIVTSQLLGSAEIYLEELVDNNPMPFNYTHLDSVRVQWHEDASVLGSKLDGSWIAHPAKDADVDVADLVVPIRNVIYGIEDLQSQEIALLPDAAAVEELMPVRPLRVFLYWPDQEISFTLGYRRGESFHWLRVDGQAEAHRIPRDLFFRLRGLLLAAGTIKP